MKYAHIISHWRNETETTMKCHFTSIRMAIIKETTIVIIGDKEKLKPLCSACGNVKWLSYFENNWHFLKKLNQMTQEFHP